MELWANENSVVNKFQQVALYRIQVLHRYTANSRDVRIAEEDVIVKFGDDKNGP